LRAKSRQIIQGRKEQKKISDLERRSGFLKKIINGSKAVAEAVKLCRPKVLPMYPVTPSTHIPEALTQMKADGELEGTPITVESEFSAISACIGASATGVRTFTATSSQGLALMHEVLHTTSGMRLPVVIAVANRALSAPINIWNDWQDSISQRDTGWIQLYCESNQEALDTMIQAYKIAEDKRVLLPVMVCMDGFYITHATEPVDIPEQETVDSFLPEYKPEHAYLDTEKPITQGPFSGPDSFIQIKFEQSTATDRSLEVIKEVAKEFGEKFGRHYPVVETYKTKDADKVILTMGTLAGTAKDAVDEMREEGKKVGLVKLKAFRPLAKKELIEALSNASEVSVIEKNISLGTNSGAVFTELRSLLYGTDPIPKTVNYIVGIGGRDVPKIDLKAAVKNTSGCGDGEIFWVGVEEVVR